MGYCGLGMQSWIYKMRPRKPFSMERKSSFTALPNHKRTFALILKTNENKFETGLVTIFVALFLVFIISVFSIESYEHLKTQTALVAKHEKIFNNEAFTFLMISGKERLKHNNIIGAYSEFNLAYKIKSQSEELNQILIETLSILCESDIEYCKKLNRGVKLSTYYNLLITNMFSIHHSINKVVKNGLLMN